MNYENIINKAEVLVEALPFIQKFRNSVMVVKFGGSAMEDPEVVRRTMCDIVMLEAIGIRPVVVHGGGKAISAELKRQDIPVKFVNGLRYTCERTIKIVDDVLHNSVNKNLVELGKAAGGNVCGISGKQVLKARKTLSVDPATGKGALHARKLVFMSDVPGILADCNDESSLIGTIRTDEIDGLVRQGVLSGGMLPKIQGCVDALDAGINKVHMIDGRLTHSLLLEIFTTSGVGTQIVRPDSVM